jgi:hypothetical protein
MVGRVVGVVFVVVWFQTNIDDIESRPGGLMTIGHAEVTIGARGKAGGGGRYFP